MQCIRPVLGPQQHQGVALGVLLQQLLRAHMHRVVVRRADALRIGCVGAGTLQ